ncbi:MAG: sulfatase-like hydrolase/transferase [Candidatus Binatia bacterium]
MTIRFALTAVALAALVSDVSAAPGRKAPKQKFSPPNILFVLMDDVGMDQMEMFGYGGAQPPPTPNLEEIADAGIRFRNAWSMPACSTSRATIFEGRFPFRTNVLGALGPADLANSMVNPYEMTVPRLLKTRGYESALFGKFHLTLPSNDPAGIGGPHALGWDFFAGYMDESGDPSSIDKTAGGVATGDTSYSCGFVPGADAGGADTGACYQPDGRCRRYKTKADGVAPGRVCRDDGGVFDPGKLCRKRVPDYIDFEKFNGHYVSPLVYNHADGRIEEVPLTDPRSRGFRTTDTTDEAIAWINRRSQQASGKRKPWMATLSYASAHTPLQQPPAAEDLRGNAASTNLDCTNPLAQRELSNLMIAQIDAQIGRLLVETKLARRNDDGVLTYEPERTNTMVVIVGDNGSLGNFVKPPFATQRAKGTAYQTGVWVPLIVSGPLVKGPNRSVSQMVNITDLYSLFGEIAGIEDVKAVVPRPVDAQPMLPYVVNPDQASIRTWNYTEVGVNLQVGGAINGPCTIQGSCTQIPMTKGVCEDNNGTWWGKEHDAPSTAGIPEDGFTYCCQVNDFVIRQGCDPTQSGCPFAITPLTSVGIRNDRYKIVKNTARNYISAEEPCRDEPTTEFYEIDEAAPLPNLDDDGDDLLAGTLTAEQQQNYDELSQQLEALLASEPDCPGDGNIDLVVDQKDLDGWSLYAQPVGTGLSSVFDFDIDGDTDLDDKAVIQAHLGTDCRAD